MNHYVLGIDLILMAISIGCIVAVAIQVRRKP